MADNTTNALTNNEVVKQGDNQFRRTVQHLPAFYRTDSNQRFLSFTGKNASVSSIPAIFEGKITALTVDFSGDA